MTEQVNSEQKLDSFLQLTADGSEILIGLLEVARRSGTRQEALNALSFMDVIDKNREVIKAQMAKVEAEEIEA